MTENKKPDQEKTNLGAAEQRFGVANDTPKIQFLNW
jgi:hypothetical protein